MVEFVNAKINLGLYVTRKREDGYHLLETMFYPVGLYAGTPENPVAFCDILEITECRDLKDGEFRFCFSGRKVDCPEDKNLVVKAARLYAETYERTTQSRLPEMEVTLEKHLPDGAGLGGGSADATFTLKALNQLAGNALDDGCMQQMALKLGADCPFFLYNTPCVGEGIGEVLAPVKLNLSGKWIVLVKPDESISTAEAFAGITPREAPFDVRNLEALPLNDWKDVLGNDFEASLFPAHPVLAGLKEQHYALGAVYAQMSGSGSTVFGIYDDKETAEASAARFRSTINGVWVLLL